MGKSLSPGNTNFYLVVIRYHLEALFANLSQMSHPTLILAQIVLDGGAPQSVIVARTMPFDPRLQSR